MNDAELSLHLPTRRRELYAEKEQLFFAIDEKSHEADLTEKGRTFSVAEGPGRVRAAGFGTRHARD
jgi:preprotein translocase subunit SecA